MLLSLIHISEGAKLRCAQRNGGFLDTGADLADDGRARADGVGHPSDSEGDDDLSLIHI